MDSYQININQINQDVEVIDLTQDENTYEG